ncbi:hypothetical protein AB0K51_09445 [Kitasatospora sp. NPDC049285]|uniref:hypothetical protein n=1 Tax=Kitasatospora sp. NPDC049285 TaxID=3157096 RepID=UPI003412C5E2
MSVPPTAEPTLWELQRSLTQLREDQRDSIAGLREDLRGDLRALTIRLEQSVSKDVYLADQRLMAQRIDMVERDIASERQAREDAETAAAVSRRWLIGAFVAPVVVAILQLWLLAQGRST